jgi:NAD(P)-dependent dehydrogenase (short-subunit alcohol dehydrogenase family)
LIEEPDLTPEVRRAMLDDTPLKRLVTAAEVAAMVRLLCSPAFDMVTGQVIVMDGGQTLPRAKGPAD